MSGGNLKVVADHRDQSGVAKPSFWRRHRWLIWIGSSGLVALLAAALGLDFLAHRFEPFIRERLIASLKDRFHTRVELGYFHVDVHHGKQAMWGLWATGRNLRIWPPQPLNWPPAATVETSPLISLAEFSFHVPLRLESVASLRIAEVVLKGLDIHVPPRTKRDRSSGLNSSMTPPPGQQPASSAPGVMPQVLVDRVICDNARLTMETDKPDKLPNVFIIPRLALLHVTAGHSAEFTAQLTNPKPQGLIATAGTFGPWDVEEPGATPVQGAYSFEHADLSTFKGIAGMLRSSGSYKGSLNDLTVDGEANVPNFRLTEFNQAVALQTTFHALVDGTDGDTWLKPVHAKLGNSEFTTEGKIVRVKASSAADEASKEREAAQPGGHLIDLSVDIAGGNLEDFMHLVSHDPTPILTGRIATQAKLRIPPGDQSVSRRMHLDGYFTLSNAQFTSDKIQKKVQELSLRGMGKPGDTKTADPNSVRSHMQGGFHMADGVIRLPDLDYAVPGADIQLHGQYALSGELHFDGTARMKATVSAMVGGWKGFLLKPVDRFFEKNGAGTFIPIKIQGTRKSPDFGIDWGRMRGTRPERPGNTNH